MKDVSDWVPLFHGCIDPLLVGRAGGGFRCNFSRWRTISRMWEALARCPRALASHHPRSPSVRGGARGQGPGPPDTPATPIDKVLITLLITAL
jgi:hypothetical protein